MMAPNASAHVEADPGLAAALESLRRSSERWARRERARLRVPSGAATVEALLGGGWPQGKVGELVGAASSGRTAVAAATVAAATARGEVAAWVDAADALDPAAAAAAGVRLDRVLWVRPRGVGEAVRAAELVLETGGFTVAVVDLGAVAIPRRAARGGAALGLRLARAAERAGAVVLVLAERPFAGAAAGATVALGRGRAQWSGGERAGPRWLAGIGLRLRVERGAARARATKAGDAFVGRVLRVCPEGVDGPGREHARSAHSTETEGLGGVRMRTAHERAAEGA